FERGVAEDAGIAHPVERTTAGGDKVFDGHALMQPGKTSDHSFLEVRLARSGEVLVALAEFTTPRARGAKAGGAMLRVQWWEIDLPPFVRAFLEVALQRYEQGRIELKPALAIEGEKFASKIEVRRLPIRRQTHDFVFLAKPGKADELANGSIEEPERMGDRH